MVLGEENVTRTAGVTAIWNRLIRGLKNLQIPQESLSKKFRGERLRENAVD